MNAGPKHWNAKLTDADVCAIRALVQPIRDIAQAYSVNPRYVRKLRSGHARKGAR